MKTTIKNLSTAPLNGLGEQKVQQPTSKRALLALTLCLSSSVSFNEAYCMDEDVDMPDKPQKVCNRQGSNSRAAVRQSANPAPQPLQQRSAGVTRVQKRVEDKKFDEALNKLVAQSQNNNVVEHETLDPSLNLKIFNDLTKALPQVDKILSKKIDDKITIILGNTGSGKSTIYNYLKGEQLIAIKDHGRLVIDVAGENASLNDDSCSRIAHGNRSGTIYPCVGRGVIDCPGFEDPGIEQQVINAYSLDKLFKKTENYRILLVLPETFNEKRYQALLDPINYLEKMFNGNFNAIKNVLNIVITKGNEKEYNVNDFKEDISAHLKPDSEFKKAFFEFCADKKNQRITFFDKPTTAGPIDYGKQIIKDQEYTNIKPTSIGLSNEAQFYIESLLINISNNILNHLDYFQKNIEDHIEKFINSYNREAKDLRKEFRDLSQGDKSIELWHPTLYSNLSILREQQQVLDLILNKMNRKTSNAIMSRCKNDENNKLTALSKYLKSFSNDITYTFDKKKQQLNLVGAIVGTSDILQKELNGLDINASKCLLIDKSITFPGAEVSFEAPHWSVIGKQTINLQGFNGQDGQDGKNGEAPSQHRKLKLDHKIIPGGEEIDETYLPYPSNAIRNATPGLDGTSGTDGGMFSGIVNTLHNGKNLTINVSGGAGGNGGTGGNGANGQDGNHGSLSDIKKKNGVPIQEEGENNDSIFIYISGTLGERGGNAGAGGLGGLGGNAGTIDFQDANSHNKITTINSIKENGEKGQDGIDGTPGKGGANGTIYQGIWYKNSLNFSDVVTKVTTRSIAVTSLALGANVFLNPVMATLTTPVAASVGGLLGAIESYWYGTEEGWEEQASQLNDAYKYAPDGNSVVRVLEQDHDEEMDEELCDDEHKDTLESPAKRARENDADLSPRPLKKKKQAITESIETSTEDSELSDESDEVVRTTKRSRDEGDDDQDPNPQPQKKQKTEQKGRGKGGKELN